MGVDAHDPPGENGLGTVGCIDGIPFIPLLFGQVLVQLVQIQGEQRGLIFQRPAGKFLFRPVGRLCR